MKEPSPARPQTQSDAASEATHTLPSRPTLVTRRFLAVVVAKAGHGRRLFVCSALMKSADPPDEESQTEPRHGDGHHRHTQYDPITL